MMLVVIVLAWVLALLALWSLMVVAAREDRRATREFERWCREERRREACRATMKTLGGRDE